MMTDKNSQLDKLAARNHLLFSLHEDLTLRTVEGRLAIVLLDLSHNRVGTIDRYDHAYMELAARASTVYEAVSRGLRWVKGKGWVDKDLKSIRILQPASLAFLAKIMMYPLH